MLKSSIWAPKAPVSLAQPSAAIIPRSSLSPKAGASTPPSTTSLISPLGSVDGQTSSQNLSIKAPALESTNLKTTRAVSAAIPRPTQADIYAAMRATNPKTATPTVTTSIARSTAPLTPQGSVSGGVPTVTSLSANSSAGELAIIKTNRSVSASATITRPTNDNIYAAMRAANPMVSASAPTITSSTSTISKERPVKTAAVARRMIVQALGIKAKEKGKAPTAGESRDCDTLEEERSGLMVIGLGGSRWASPEERAKAVPRPIEEFWEVQRQGQDKYNKMVNETMSLRFDRAPVVPLKVETPHRRITYEDIMAAMRAAVVVKV